MCNNCQNTTCYQCNHPPLCAPNDCSCPVKDLSTDCVLYTGNDLACSGIKSQTILTELIQQLDEFICTLVEQSLDALSLINIGTGANVYKGLDLLGRREIRRINAVGDLVTVTQNTNDISVSIDEKELSNFIQNELPNPPCFETSDGTISIKELINGCYDFSVIFREIGNVGTGAGFYKTFNPLTNTYEFKSLIVDSQNGDGTSILRDVQQNSEDVTVRLKKIKSNTLTITSTDEELLIDTPLTSAIPALYVNNLYEPTYQEWLAENTSQNLGTPVPGFEYIGKGTSAQPFTDTVSYTLGNPLSTPVVTANTAIQNALDVYVGTGSRLNPDLSGQTIIVQANSVGYAFNGDLDYSNLKIRFEESVIFTTTGYLVDMDNSSNFDSETSSVSIEVSEGKSLYISDSLGFRNSGNTSTTPPSYNTGRIVFLLGEGEIYSDYNGVDVLSRYIINGEGNNNDDGLHFQVKCQLRSLYSGIYYSKNKQRIDFYNQITSGILNGYVNVSLQALKMTGGQIRFFEKAAINISSQFSGRNYGFTFEPQNSGIGYCSFQLNSAKVSGSANYMFSKLNNENVDFIAFNSPSGSGFATVIPGTNTVVNGLFENLGASKWEVNFKNNVFSFTGIDFDKVDLTQGNNVSSTNFIGNNIIESLVVHSSKQAAQNAGITKGSKFLKKTLINATDIVAGLEYKIASIGTTDFTLIGADSNTVDEWFVATGTVSGTGTVYVEFIEIV